MNKNRFTLAIILGVVLFFLLITADYIRSSEIMILQNLLQSVVAMVVIAGLSWLFRANKSKNKNNTPF